MKTIIFLVFVLSLPVFAGDALQDLANITAIQANQRKADPVVVNVQSYQSPAVSPQTLDFIRQKECEYNELVKKYNALYAENVKLSAKYNALLKVSSSASVEKADSLAEQQVAFDAAVAESHAKVAAAFPVYSQADHPIHAVADEIYKKFEKAKSPVVYQSDCPWIVYSLAAKKLGINPVIQ